MGSDTRVGSGGGPARGDEQVEAEEAAVTAAFITFLKEASERRHPTGPMRRFNQGRASGCVEAEFVVPDGLAPELRVGLFAQSARHPARIRFASASSSSDTARDTRGMSIKVPGAAASNLTAGCTDQDFILNSHPVMMVANTREFLELLTANEAGGLQRILYFLRHLRTVNIAREAQQQPTCHLDIPYWSTVPYRFGGAGTAVKYAVRPTSAKKSRKPAELTDHYLQQNLRAHLASDEATFDVLVQFQADGTRTPIEDASIEWKENLSPFRKVAELRIPPQRVGEADADACEALEFNPWHCLAAHQPLGNMNRARREIYRSMAEFRAARR